MNFNEIAITRQSCRNFDDGRPVEQEKIDAIVRTVQLAPSACNGQPYFLTVCKGEVAKQVALTSTSRGMNKFTAKAPIIMVLSEMPYVATAAFGAKVLDNDYRSMDIGIAAAYLTAEAAAQGLGSCMIGWFDDKRVRELCGLDHKVRLLFAIGYAAHDDKLRDKKRKDLEELTKEV